jgi:hypothetical protein
MTLTKQRISTASNGGTTMQIRKVSHVKQAWGTETGFITFVGSTFRVSRMIGQNYWVIDKHVTIYPAGHPLEVLNPVEFRATEAK